MKLFTIYLKRILYLGLILSIIQITIIVLTFVKVTDVSPLWQGMIEDSVGWSIFIYFAFWGIVFVSIFINFMFSLFRVSWFTQLAVIGLEMFYIYFLFPTLDYRPYRVLLLLLLSLFVVLSSIFVAKKVGQKLPLDYSRINGLLKN